MLIYILTLEYQKLKADKQSHGKLISQIIILLFAISLLPNALNPSPIEQKEMLIIFYSMANINHGGIGQ